MKLIQFCKWWWNNRRSDEKALTVFFTGIVSMFIGVYFFGPIAFLFFLGLILLGGVIALLWVIFTSIRKQYRRFTEEQEREAERIVDRLRRGR